MVAMVTSLCMLKTSISWQISNTVKIAHSGTFVLELKSKLNRCRWGYVAGQGELLSEWSLVSTNRLHYLVGAPNTL